MIHDRVRGCMNCRHWYNGVCSPPCNNCIGVTTPLPHPNWELEIEEPTSSSKIKIYVSHPIRGAKGKDATREDMEAANRLAIKFGEALKAQFPSIEFYVPAAHDEFVIIGYEQNIITEEEILYIDCEIVDTCQVVIAYIPDRHVSNGMFTEITHAHKNGIPVLVVMDDTAIDVIQRYLEGLKS